MPLEPRKTIGVFTVFERVPKPRGLTKYVVGWVDMDDREKAEDFGKYSTAIRFAKQRTPRPSPHVVVFYEDKTAIATSPVDVTIIDGEFKHTAPAAVDPAMVAGLKLKPKAT